MDRTSSVKINVSGPSTIQFGVWEDSAARTILLFHIISARPPEQPRMVRTFLKVHTLLKVHIHRPSKQPRVVRTFDLDFL